MHTGNNFTHPMSTCCRQITTQIQCHCLCNATQIHPPRHRNYKSPFTLATTLTHPLTTCQLDVSDSLIFQEGASSRTSYTVQTPMCQWNWFGRQFFYLSQRRRAKPQKSPQTSPRPQSMVLLQPVPITYHLMPSERFIHSFLQRAGWMKQLCQGRPMAIGHLVLRSYK